MEDAPLLPGLSPPPKRSRLRGRIWQGVGIVFLIAAFMWLGVAGMLADTYHTDIPTGLPLTLLAIVGVRCYLRGKRHLAIAATELLARDPRPPVVYLRSFQADKKAAQSAEGSRLLGGWHALFDLKTVEERLADMLSAFGPVIAIGKPGEKLPALGAARLYVSNEEWQHTVHAIMDRAALVVLRLGDTPGFWWELEHSVKSLDPTKLVLIVPFKRKEYEAFRERTAERFPHPLPAYGSHTGFLSFRFRPRRGLGRLLGLVYFKPDWAPEYVDLTRIKYPWRMTPRYFGRSRLLKSLNWNFRSVFEQRNVAWKPPKTRWVMTTVVVSVFLLMGVSLVSAIAVPALLRARQAGAFNHAVQLFVTAVQNSTEVQHAYGALTVDDSNTKGRELARAGLLRLPDEELIAREALIEQVMARTGTTNCVGMVTEAPNADVIESELKFMDSAAVHEWFRILTDAALAEARKSPDALLPDDDKTRAAFEKFVNGDPANLWGMPGHSSSGLSDTVIVTRQHTKADGMKYLLQTFDASDVFGFVQITYDQVCRTMTDIHHAVTTLPPPMNGHLARALAMAEAK